MSAKKDTKKGLVITTRQPKAKTGMFSSLRKPEEIDEPPDFLPVEIHKVDDVVNQNEDERLTENQKVVNQTSQDGLTENEETVNQTPIPVNKLTENKQEIVNKLTENQKVVNQKLQIRLTRNKHRETVEGFRTSHALRKQVKEFCAKKGIDKQDFYEYAVNHFFECVVNQEESELVNKSTIDDRDMMKMYKTTPTIINLYVKYNPDNKWKPQDDAIAHKYNNADIRLIEIAIIKTQIAANFKKINSFKYFLTEIEDYLSVEYGEQTKDAILETAKKRWREAKREGKS